jgi:hypothetical protein
MKYLLFILSLLMSLTLVHADEAPKVPHGVRYKPAPAKVNDKARELLRRKFSADASDEEVLSLFETLVICGPGLWQDLKNDAALSRIRHGKVSFKVPVRGPDGKVVRTDTLDGKVFQTADEVLLFWRAFSARTDFDGLKIRKLNTEEIKIFWAMIPFDITEPLFILESEQHKLLVVFKAPDELKIAWVDDYQDIALKPQRSRPAARAGE